MLIKRAFSAMVPLLVLTVLSIKIEVPAILHLSRYRPAPRQGLGLRRQYGIERSFSGSVKRDSHRIKLIHGDQRLTAAPAAPGF